MRSYRRLVAASAVVVLAASLLGLTAWAVESSYDFDLARCGALPPSYSPELGWLFFVAPPAFLGLLMAGAVSFLEINHSAPKTDIRWLLVTVAGLLVGLAGALAVSYFVVDCGYRP